MVSGRSPCDDLGAVHRNVPATATASQRHLCCSHRGVTTKISAVGAAPHSHRPRKSPATLAGHVQSHQSARLAKSSGEFEYRGQSRSLSGASNGQKSQDLGLAARFFRTSLMWNSATDFPAMLLGTIS